jgi:maleylacetoacetate isomerase
VRIALNLKKIEYEYSAIDLTNVDPSFAKKNPRKAVPALDIDGHILTQSLAIIEYLEESRSDQGVRLLPTDIFLRAQVRKISLAVVADIQPLQNRIVLNKVKGFGQDSNEWAVHFITHNFLALEESLKETEKNGFCVGGELSMADVCLVPQYFKAKGFGVDVARFETMTRIVENVSSIEEFERAKPEYQPDFPKQ